jgi:hypothetical protein
MKTSIFLVEKGAKGVNMFWTNLSLESMGFESFLSLLQINNLISILKFYIEKISLLETKILRL